MSEAQWYVVHTYSGYENKVKVDIEKTIENRGLQEQILEVSVPMEEVVELTYRYSREVEHSDQNPERLEHFMEKNPWIRVKK